MMYNILSTQRLKSRIQKVLANDDFNTFSREKVKKLMDLMNLRNDDWTYYCKVRPLYMAVEEEDFVMTRLLLDVSSPPQRYQALMGAVETGNADLVRLVLGYGADPGIKAIMLAVEMDNADIVSLLFEYGADPTDEVVTRALEYGGDDTVDIVVRHSVEMDNADIVSLLFEYGADPTDEVVTRAFEYGGDDTVGASWFVTEE